MEVTAFLALGTNLGNRIENLDRARKLIEEHCGPIQSSSSIYETPAVGFESKNDFLNSCISIRTSLNPEELLRVTQHIERELGRELKSQEGYSDRLIDIDIIFYGEEIIEYSHLQVPHKKFRERMFVLKPLNDIAKTFTDPVTKQTIPTLIDKCVDKTPISIYQ